MALNRRQVVCGLSASTALSSASLAQIGPASVGFDAELQNALTDTNALEAARSFREAPAIIYDMVATRKVAPRLAPIKLSNLSDRAVRLIIGFEVSSPGTYTLKYQSPIWPRGASGVTIGVGYDVGYVEKQWLREDWAAYLNQADLTTLEAGCEVTGVAARKLLPQMQSVSIPWQLANKQFLDITLPRFTAETVNYLPNAMDLATRHPDSFGALLSLDYNRGPSYKRVGDRYQEMRQIRLHMVNKAYSKIPEQLRRMKRIWEGNPDARGLLVRRELEAKLFETGLTNAA